MKNLFLQEFTNPAVGHPQRMVYTVQDKAWDDQHMHSEWLDRVWLPYCR